METQSEDDKTIHKAVYMLHRLEQIPFELDEELKESEQPDYLIMAYAEIKRMINELMCEAEKSAEEYMKSNNESKN